MRHEGASTGHAKLASGICMLCCKITCTVISGVCIEIYYGVAETIWILITESERFLIVSK